MAQRWLPLVVCLQYFAIVTIKGGVVSEVPDPNMVSKCSHGICEDLPSYPENLAAKLTKQLQAQNLSFNEDALPATPERFGNDAQEFMLCQSEEKLITPKAAQDLNGDWYYILNPKDNLVQKFRVEICTGHNYMTELKLNPSYEGKCEQKTVLRKMYAFKGSNVTYDDFQIPSCCDCVIKGKDFEDLMWGSFTK